jgi:hypothetical protein
MNGANRLAAAAGLKFGFAGILVETRKSGEP